MTRMAGEMREAIEMHQPMTSYSLHYKTLAAHLLGAHLATE